MSSYKQYNTVYTVRAANDGGAAFDGTLHRELRTLKILCVCLKKGFYTACPLWTTAAATPRMIISSRLIGCVRTRLMIQIDTFEPLCAGLVFSDITTCQRK